MKTIKVDHVVLTLALSQLSLTTGGESKQSIDEKVNARLAEGYDDVETFLLRANYDERQQPTHAILLYIFKKYEKDNASKIAQAISDAPLPKKKTKKEDAPAN